MRVALEHVDPGPHRLGLGDHGAQLPELEGLAVAADPPLAVQHRAAALEADRDGRDRDHGRGDRQRERGDGDVEGTASVRHRRMRILYLHQFFVTRAGVGSTRSYEFARRFVARGHEVRIVTAPGAAGPGTSRVDGIEVVAVRGAYSDYVQATSLSYPRRMLAFARFALSATAAALRGPRPDVVYATSPPLTMALPALAVAAARRVPVVWEVRDLWPEAPIQMGALRSPLLRRAARALERFVYRRAARLIALSPGIRAGMVAAGAPRRRVALVPNASDLDLFRPADPPERFRVSYFGTMGEANDLTAAVEAARLLP
jgi:glycosyltransferase involved in cell wall biosynthesis